MAANDLQNHEDGENTNGDYLRVPDNLNSGKSLENRYGGSLGIFIKQVLLVGTRFH